MDMRRLRKIPYTPKTEGGILIKKLLAALLVSTLLIAYVPADQSMGSGENVNDLLIDLGNGTTYWGERSGGTCLSDAENLLDGLEITYVTENNSFKKIGDFENTDYCYWTLYMWSENKWIPSEDATGVVAWGFYPDGTCPVETPDSQSCWTQIGGNSSSSGHSDSYAPSYAATPLEWTKTYDTGFVDSSILVAGDYIYHSTLGNEKGEGDSAHAWFYCENRFTGEEKWKFDLSTGNGLYDDYDSLGYNLTTAIIVGNYVLINSASAHNNTLGQTTMDFYCIDRMTGELTDSKQIVHNPPSDMEGRMFVNGGTTPVYDSGRIYMGTSDGRVLEFELSGGGKLTQTREFVPSDDYRGSFYFYPPTVVTVDGKRTMFVGNYAGAAISIDLKSFEANWYKDLNDADRGIVSVSGFSLIPGEKILIKYCDPGMTPAFGSLVCIDGLTGNTEYWTIPVESSSIIVTDDGFYAFLFTYQPGDKLYYADGTECEMCHGLYKFNFDGKVLWHSKDFNFVKSGMTLCDGVIYVMQYSAGVFYPSGGGLIAIDAENGNELWMVKLTPFSKDSYSMVAPTVIDGKIYVGNDYGAVYCISETKGPGWEPSEDITIGGSLLHWSWIVIYAIVAGAVFCLWKFY